VSLGVRLRGGFDLDPQNFSLTSTSSEEYGGSGHQIDQKVQPGQRQVLCLSLKHENWHALTSFYSI
jgi:hypothetical protein